MKQTAEEKNYTFYIIYLVPNKTNIILFSQLETNNENKIIFI